MADANPTIQWITVAVLILISLGATTLILQPDSFEIKLKDGTIKARYSEGIFKAYEGRYLAFSDQIKIYYWNGKGYTSMYKARGNKYSNLSYYEENETVYLKQDIYYSQGNLTRYFEITEYTIKENFEWNPNDPNLRVYFRWEYDDLDEDKPAVYVDKSTKQPAAKMDFGVINNWEKERDNIVRAERYKNGKLVIRTRVYEGKAYLALNAIGTTYVFNASYSLGDLNVTKGVPYTHWRESLEKAIKERNTLRNIVKPRFKIM
jgi:hypothetical protein